MYGLPRLERSAGFDGENEYFSLLVAVNGDHVRETSATGAAMSPRKRASGVLLLINQNKTTPESPGRNSL